MAFRTLLHMDVRCDINLFNKHFCCLSIGSHNINSALRQVYGVVTCGEISA